jgi:D-glycero-beta-D-manno-heptose 1-phosphate adenylyltransferase
VFNFKGTITLNPPSTMSLDSLIPLIETLKQQGKRIVTTNGCFDLLHVGHVRYLQASKALGDVLVVLVNSDASVKQFKGDERPIVSEEERLELLAALKCVDYTVLFDAPTPIEALKRIAPNIHTKGGQYTVETLPEYPVLNALGCDVQFINMVHGRSTSDIISKIQRVYAPRTSL